MVLISLAIAHFTLLANSIIEIRNFGQKDGVKYVHVISRYDN